MFVELVLKHSFSYNCTQKYISFIPMQNEIDKQALFVDESGGWVYENVVGVVANAENNGLCVTLLSMFTKYI